MSIGKQPLSQGLAHRYLVRWAPDWKWQPWLQGLQCGKDPEHYMPSKVRGFFRRQHENQANPLPQVVSALFGNKTAPWEIKSGRRPVSPGRKCKSGLPDYLPKGEWSTWKVKSQRSSMSSLCPYFFTKQPHTAFETWEWVSCRRQNRKRRTLPFLHD